MVSLRRQLQRGPSPEAIAITAKDLLRTARHGLTVARHRAPVLAETENLPGEALARSLTSEAGRIAFEAIDTGTRLARLLLDPAAVRHPPTILPVRGLVAGGELEAAAFAEAGYLALRVLLRRLGAVSALVILRGLKAAFEDAVAGGATLGLEERSSRFTARLAAAMTERTIVVDVTLDPARAERLTVPEVVSVARLALCLAIEAGSREGASGVIPDDLLLAAADLARSLAPEIVAAGPHEAAIAAIIGRYADHV